MTYLRVVEEKIPTRGYTAYVAINWEWKPKARNEFRKIEIECGWEYLLVQGIHLSLRMNHQINIFVSFGVFAIRIFLTKLEKPVYVQLITSLISKLLRFFKE